MNSGHTDDSRMAKLIKLAIGVALPTFSCFGFYTVGRMDNPDSLTIFFTVLAYPTILLAVIGLIKSLMTKPISKPKCSFWAGLVMVPLLFLANLWL